MQVAWVSGASGDIGLAITKRLLVSGYHVAALYYQHATHLEKLAGNDRLIILPIDIRDGEQIHACYREICWRWREPSICIHAAGHAHTALLQDEDETTYQQMMDVHMGGAFRMVRMSLPAMIRNRYGRVILLSSIWAEVGGAGEVLYSAAKGAINGFTKALAKEVAPSKITVNAIAPGAVEGQMLQNQLSTDEQEALKEEIPLGRMAHPSEIASLVEYLCRPEASYITGQVLRIDGGWI
ncbi:3-oxoacyl-[acyl-carrier protein] reductase [Seinonella peptonophila]|uniref:3-oxoacyl-[acyl-carrier protein] reductase n=1 Tax=Seinonella peptonophila TaxID=112248 RepID=A0A1M4TBJ8_9BACL|nr:SDR family oxidoreductase [Seinonella peptonophila]SHE41758.1 3-oxoacyl-[acyl-carrier protein] reductase [Seinonella peptonophila]